MNYSDESSKEWAETAALLAPGLLGAAAGMALGEMMHENARRGIAVGLAVIGVAALVPYVINEVTERVNGPDSQRGMQRRLRGIRDAGYGAIDDIEELAGGDV